MKAFLLSLVLLVVSACPKNSQGPTEYPPLRDAPEDPTQIDAGAKVIAKKKEVKPVESTMPKAVAELPEDQRKPPTDAKTTPKGVKYVVLHKGSGKEKPSSTDKVTVHYIGWTTDGKSFDSSVSRGEPIKLPVGGVIPGWVDTLQQMVAGDRWRVWIPEKLAYDGQAGAPAGMLIFDMELLAIH
jgi:FKBP-type peptidyl-prolyl cis-trans isomerase